MYRQPKPASHQFLDRDFLEVFQTCINCINLDKLSIWGCPQLSDYHLFELARRGVRLSELWLCGCNGITDDGVISILINSADKLQAFGANQSSHVTDLAYRLATELCRCIKWSYFRNEDLKNFACSKSFKKLDHVMKVF